MINSYPVLLNTLPLGYSHKDRLGQPTIGMPVERKVRPLNSTLAELDAAAHAPRSFTEPRLKGGVPLSFK